MANLGYLNLISLTFFFYFCEICPLIDRIDNYRGQTNVVQHQLPRKKKKTESETKNQSERCKR